MLLRHSFLLSIAATLPSIAQAALYPTYPTSDTTIQAEKDIIIKWKNDDKQPALWDLGKLNVDLFVGDDDHHVITLATKINPEDRAALIRIEPWAGADADDYYIRFTSSQPQESIYTSRFAIRGLSGYYKDHGKNDRDGDRDGDRQLNEAQAVDSQDGTNEEDGSVEITGEEDSGESGSENGDEMDNPEGTSFVGAQGVGGGESQQMAATLISVSGTSTFTVMGTFTGGAQPSLFPGSATTSMTSSSIRFIPLTPTAPFSNPSATSTGGTFIDNSNAASTRFKRSHDNSNGFSGMGLVHFVWPIVMGAVMAF